MPLSICHCRYLYSNSEIVVSTTRLVYSDYSCEVQYLIGTVVNYMNNMNNKCHPCLPGDFKLINISPTHRIYNDKCLVVECQGSLSHIYVYLHVQ